MNRKKEGKHLPIIILLLVNSAWGLDFLAIEHMVKYLPASMISFSRLLIGAIFLVGFVFLKEGGIKIAKQDWPRVFLCGAIGLSLYFTVEPIGISMTSGAIGALIMATVPIIGMLADYFIFHNPITKLKVAAIFFSILGVAILILGGNSGGMNANPAGVLVMLIAALMWTGFIVLVKPLYEKYNITTILAGMFVAGVITSAPIMLFDLGRPVHFNISIVSLIVITSLICVVLGEFCYVYSVGKLSVTMVALFENVLPIVSVIFSFIIFGQSLSIPQILGGLIIMISVSIVALKE